MLHEAKLRLVISFALNRIVIMKIFWPTATALVLCSATALAQQQAVPPAGGAAARAAQLDESGLAGVVVNQTFTRFGQEFYRLFTQGLQDQAALQSRVLSIVEKPSRRLGNRITVLSGQTPVFDAILPFKQDKLAAFATQALDAVAANIAALMLESGALTGADLAPNEL